MRFGLAIVAFVAAAVMIGLGIAQRTVFLGPDRVVLSTQVENPAPYLVVTPEVMGAHPGAQTLTVNGPGDVFVAYGRTGDVLGWIGEAPYTSVGYQAEADALIAKPAHAKLLPQAAPTAPFTQPAPPAADSPLPVNPAGSDLWLDEYNVEYSLSTTLDLPKGISVIIASDGVEAAPAELRVEWPIENPTPWAGPLLVGGALFFLVGVWFLVTGLIRYRRSRGPRRNLPSKSLWPRRGRKELAPPTDRPALERAPRIALGLAMVPALFLTSCSADYWPRFDEGSPTAAPTSSGTPDPQASRVAGEDATDSDTDGGDDDDAAELKPAVTVPQMERILRKIAVVATDADTNRDTEKLRSRFTGPALEAREANYAIRETLPDHSPLPAIPAAPVTLTLPQQTAGTWPRVVMTITQNEDDPTVAPTTLILVQNSPRENYLVQYAMQLAPEETTPDVAPASIGAPRIAADSKFLALPPSELAAAYGDVLLNGDESEFADLFDTESDLLIAQIGVPGQATIRESLPPTADITFTNAPGQGPPVAIATNDSGAIVAVDLKQTETVRPNDGGTIGFEEGAPGGALSGFTGKSAKGVTRVVGIQLVFSVPSAGSDRLIELLGWTESLVSASEVT